MGHDCCDHDHCATDGAPGGAFRVVLWIALVLNGGMFAVEATSGLYAGSVSLQADAVDFLGDAANYALSLIVLGWGAAWRARVAALKGVAMAGFGVWVLGYTAYCALLVRVPAFEVMGTIGSIALVVNVVCALLLFRFREGDANMRSVWLCSRNDALANLAVIVAAGGVWGTGTPWPDLAVGVVIAVLGLNSGFHVLGRARRELAVTA